ncbi:MAG TPA: DUF3516 domain-containing protein [Eggerthellaceae bacterium]|nr:DUF3516 domain-containing protein [Eggerthellaceae bacterium]
MESSLEDIAIASDELPESTQLGRIAQGAFSQGADADEAFSLFLEYEEADGIQLWSHQEDACMAIALGDHVVLGTPTGSGKSTVALWLAFLALATGQRMYYTAPIKALVSEKFFDFVKRLGRDNVGMVTGDVSINGAAPVICCTAEILANEALRFGHDANVAYAALDEFHFFGDRERGWAWQVPLISLPYTQFLLMSATLGDTGTIAAKLEEQTRRPVTTIADAPRPVPLEYQFADDTSLEGTVELALRRDEAPIYIVHFSQDEALKSAQSLASFGISTKEQREAIKRELSDGRFTTAFGKTLKRLLLMGVGVHHAGMLPRYRRTVERLAQLGLLPVICGTDTLGMGINVPIRTVLLTALAKYDGARVRRLNAREFHQIAGRAGRSGFDTQGSVIAQATKYDIERKRALAKAGGDPKKARKIKTSKPPEGFVGWNEDTYRRLIEAVPEKLHPRMQMTHAMALAEIMQGGPAWQRTHDLVDASMQDDDQKERLHQRTDEVFATLEAASLVACDRSARGEGEDGEWSVVGEVPEGFALDQPLSPFLLVALELLDREEETYALDLISLVESTLEQPRQILRAQEKEARSAAVAAMKAEGIEYEERMERLEEITYPKPLEDLLQAAFSTYCKAMPWALDYELAPKSVLRDMVETASDFKTYVQRYGLARCEGILLRYLSDAYHVLDRTVPPEFFDERLDDIVCWLGWLVQSIDSSLFDEWAGNDEDAEARDAAAPGAQDAVVADRRALILLVRNALFARVRLAALGKVAELGALDADWGWPEARWQQALDAYFAEHEEILIDAHARSAAYLDIDESPETAEHQWRVRQIFLDDVADLDFRIEADLDLDASQEESQAVFKNYRVGFVEDLA